MIRQMGGACRFGSHGRDQAAWADPTQRTTDWHIFSFADPAVIIQFGFGSWATKKNHL
jgi:hypothetical protein